MNYLKTGLILSTLIILIAIFLLGSEVLEISTVRDVFIIPAIIINVSLIFKLFKIKKEVIE